MLGWLVIVSTSSSEESNVSDNVIARWEVGPGGTNWIEKLVRSGKAEQQSFSGYPSRYIARAGDILPLLAEGPPAHTGPAIFGDDYVLPANWRGQVTMYSERIQSCTNESMLTIDAWDQS